MNKVSPQQVIEGVRNESKEVLSSIRDAARDIRRPTADPASDHGPWIDPIRMKRLLLALLKVLIIIELVSAFLEGAGAGRWARFGVDLVIAGLLYVLLKIAVTGKGGVENNLVFHFELSFCSRWQYCDSGGRRS